MAHAKRIRHSPVIQFNGNNEAPTFRVKVLEAFESLLALGADDESAWLQAGPIARNLMRQQNFPIASMPSGTYDGEPMNGTEKKPKNGTAQKVTEDPLDVVLSRAVSKLVANEGLTISGSEKKHGLPTRFLYRLVKEPTPGRAGENIDKVCKVFGLTRRQIEDLGSS